MKTNEVNTGIKNEDEGRYIDWGEIFFILHKECNLNKWEIWEYTLPQVTELIKSSNKRISFEVELGKYSILEAVNVVFGGGKEETAMNEDGYRIATSDDIDLLAQMLGG